jgi:hypothetical protein
LNRQPEGLQGNAENAKRHAEMLKGVREEVPRRRVVEITSIERLGKWPRRSETSVRSWWNFGAERHTRAAPHIDGSTTGPKIHLYQKCPVPLDVPTDPSTMAMQKERARIHNARTRTAHPVLSRC